jgi:hypothetical protein
MRISCVQLCQGPDVIASLEGEGRNNWFVEGKLVRDDSEIDQLEAEISGEGTGYMCFQGVEYEDVRVVVVR